MSVLQKHVAFFDRDGDGIITPWDTYVGFRNIGFNIPFSIFAMFVINVSFAWVTQPYWFPNPLFWLYVENIHSAKHGSDSESYDTEGRFVPEKFEEIFSKFDTKDKHGLTLKELFSLMYHQRNIFDFFGWWAQFFEWGTLWLLCQENGEISKEDVRSCLDGTLFYKKDDERKRKHNKAAKAQRKRT